MEISGVDKWVLLKKSMCCKTSQLHHSGNTNMNYKAATDTFCMIADNAQ